MHSAVFDHFKPVSLIFLTDLVANMTTTSCPLDTFPTKLLKEVFSTVGSSLWILINSCLSFGFVPSSFKHAVVRPLLKKTHLDPNVLSNFRPVSNLSFISKVLEKTLHSNNHFWNVTPFLRSFSLDLDSDSTESALLKVHNDIALSVDKKCPVMLVLLDLTAAYDTVDHSVLLSRLKENVGLCGTALKCFQSYLTNRTFSVMIGDLSTSVASLSCGVPQGSILVPMLFSLYMFPLGSIIERHNLAFHCYADDL